MKHLMNSLFITLLLLTNSTLFAQSPNSSYVIQSSDWLSKIAKTAYGDANNYTKIIQATNEKAAVDNSFKQIKNANSVTVGQKIWIPSIAPNSTTTTNTNATPTSKNMLAAPSTNCDIRLWYNYQVVAIGKINERWEEEGLPLKERAEKAYKLRHEARVNARFMMPEKSQVKALQARDMTKYGNPDGPTFEYLIKKNTDKGKTLEEAYQSIIDSSSRTDTKYNQDCQ
ncbi:MAG: LysM peptidoglycan-binding domain-containing protein [Saprospiraceae bacterium]